MDNLSCLECIYSTKTVYIKRKYIFLTITVQFSHNPHLPNHERYAVEYMPDDHHKLESHVAYFKYKQV